MKHIGLIPTSGQVKALHLSSHLSRVANPLSLLTILTEKFGIIEPDTVDFHFIHKSEVGYASIDEEIIDDYE